MKHLATLSKTRVPSKADDKGLTDLNCGALKQILGKCTLGEI